MSGSKRRHYDQIQLAKLVQDIAPLFGLELDRISTVKAKITFNDADYLKIAEKVKSEIDRICEAEWWRRES